MKCWLRKSSSQQELFHFAVQTADSLRLKLADLQVSIPLKSPGHLPKSPTLFCAPETEEEIIMQLARP